MEKKTSSRNRYLSGLDFGKSTKVKEVQENSWLIFVVIVDQIKIMPVGPSTARSLLEIRQIYKAQTKHHWG